MDHKWDLHVEGHAGKLCVTGALTLPVHGVKKFTYTNKIGFGATCTQHVITMTGFTITSNSLKDRRPSPSLSAKLNISSMSVSSTGTGRFFMIWVKSSYGNVFI